MGLWQWLAVYFAKRRWSGSVVYRPMAICGDSFGGAGSHRLGWGRDYHHRGKDFRFQAQWRQHLKQGKGTSRQAAFVMKLLETLL